MGKSTCILLSVVFLFGYSAFADNSSSTPPIPSQGSNIVPGAVKLECPQCGIWRLSYSEPAGLVNDFVFVDDHQMVIPGCGVFTYKVEKSKTTVEDSNIYDLSLSLSPRMLLLCKKLDGGDWKMAVKVRGRGSADFVLGEETKPTLVLIGWNIDREGPCEWGGGEDTARCLYMNERLAFKILSTKVEQAYEKLLKSNPPSKLPTFSAERFSATVTTFCEDKEKNSGGGSWPYAWAYTCKNRILESKLKEFSVWNDCMENKHKTCIFPTENFDRSSKSEVER
jgi:hypothetical protein